MVFRKRSSVLNVALLISLMTAVTPFAASVKVSSALAQAASQAPSTAPMAVPKGTTVRISGSSSMAAINQTLKQRFETQYPDARVTVSDAASSTGLQDLVAGKTDLVAIGRSLTPNEQAQGLIAVPVARRKIAIVVSTDNPFKGNLTTMQVVQILQGKITDWSEVGGAPGLIRVLDRPSNSDLRQALQSYPLFEPLSSPGATVTPVSEDSTQAVIQQLGKNGIGYVAANEVVNQPTVRMMALHRALPTDPSYPFSQPLSYVYKGRAPSAAIAAFLKYATSPDAQSAIQTAVQTAQVPASAASDKATPTSIPSTGANPSSPSGSLASASSIPVATELSETASTSATGFNTAVGQKTTASTDPTGGILPWLVWLLPLGIAAVLVAWLIKNRRPASDGAHSESLPPVPPDATPSIDPTTAGDPDPNPASRAESVINGDRAAIAQAQPEASRIGGVASEDGLASTEALAGANADEALSTPTVDTSPLDTSPLDLGEIRDPWEPSDVSQEAAFDTATVSTPSHPSLDVASSQEAGSESFTQNTSEPEESLVSFDLIEELDNLETQLEANEAEDLILTNEAATIEPVESAKVVDPNVASMADLEPSPTHIQEQPDLAPATDLLGGAAIAGAAVSGLSAPPLDATSDSLEPNPLERNDESAEQTKVEAAKYDVGQTDLSRETLASVDEGLPELPAGYGETRIVLMPRDPQWAYAYWDVPNDRREALRRQGGQRLALRLYDVTDVDLAHQSPHSLQQYDCEELARDWYVAIPVSDRDYLAEIGYLTEEGHWLMLARSAPIRVPPVYPSEWASDQYVTIDWDDDLRGKTVLELVPSERHSSPDPIKDELFELAQGGESQRIAGSLFSSMQHVPQSAISSFVFPTGMGMWALPTPSGMGGSGALTMSGINMSGINMSGVGFSVPSIRPRKFWLVADAELIVYGATEPDATVTIAGQPIALNPDGTFRFQMSFQDGLMDYPIMAVAADGEQTRSIHLTFNRETLSRRTNSKEEATDEWRS